MKVSLYKVGTDCKELRESMEEKEYLNSDEAKAFLGVSRPTLFRMIKDFNIQVYTLVGKANYYKRSDLQKIKETRSQFRPKSPQTIAA